MKTRDFYYELPPRLIAQTPAEKRDASRMLVCSRHGALRAHRRFTDLPDFLKPGDLLVLNESRVLPARLRGVRADSGAAAELLLLRPLGADVWETLVHPGRRLKKGAEVVFGDGLLSARIGETTPAGGRLVQFRFQGSFRALLDRLGEMPLPPYIRTKLPDPERYQTVYAAREGSVAAPTAGLHFTPETLQRLQQKGVNVAKVLLHVGLGTFRPVREADPRDHAMHSEYYSLSEQSAEQINRTRRAGGRVLCVGTTSVRTLETQARPDGTVEPGSGMTELFLLPGAGFLVTDLLLTNFHLPESTLLMLVCAFMGTDSALDAYREAVKEEYRFFSFGDCMLIGDGLLEA